MLKVSNCSFTSKFEFEVESGVSMIIGPNGAGKTTFLNVISGVIKPPLCKVLLDGEEISQLPTNEIVKKGVVLVPSGRANFPELTVEENLRLGLYVGRTRGSREKVLGEIYDLFPVLKERKNQVAATLSGGEQKMLAIARGLAASPKILLLDEPSFGLGPKVVESIYDSFRKIRETTAIIISEQGISTAIDFREIIDQVYFIINHEFTFKGKIEQLESIDDVRRVYFGI